MSIRWLIIGVLAAVAFIFLPVLHQGFIYLDDALHLLDNPHTRSLDLSTIQATFQSTINKTYIPLTILSFAIEHRFFGYDPFIYHLDNLLLHLGVVAAVYVLALRLGLNIPAAAASAFFFGLHPMHVESVAWVTERKDVLYSFFYVLALIFYTGYIKTLNSRDYAAAFFCATLSILAKPMALSLPLILFVFDWYFKRTWGRRILFEKVPFFAVIGFITWQTYVLHARGIHVPWDQGVLTWLWCLAFYIKTFLVPGELCLIYQLPRPIDINSPAYAAAVVIVVVAAVLLFVLRKQRLLVFAAAYFFLSIFFLLRFDDRQDMNITADRFMYLPSLGLCIWIGALLSHLVGHARMKTLTTASVIIFMLALAAQTYAQVRQWDDPLLLWARSAQRYPNGLTYLELGREFFTHGDSARAMHCFNEAIRLYPEGIKAHINRGILYLNAGMHAQAQADLDFAIAQFSDPQQTADRKDLRVAYAHRGLVRWLLGRPEEALEDYAQALALDSNYKTPYVNRSRLYEAQGDLVKASADLERALRIDPKDEKVRNSLQRILAQKH